MSLQHKYGQFVTAAQEEKLAEMVENSKPSDVRSRDTSWSRDSLETHFTGLGYGLGLRSLGLGLGLEGKRLGLERIRSRMFQDHSIVPINHSQTIIIL